MKPILKDQQHRNLAFWGMAMIAMGLVFAVWVIVLGGAVLLLGIVGWMFEYYRGEFAR